MLSAQLKRRRQDWNRPGVYGAIRLAATEQGALAERAKYAAQAALAGLPFGAHDLVSLEVTVRRALDLRARFAVQRRFGVTTAELRADGAGAHARCRQTADLARARGDFVLLVVGQFEVTAPATALTG